MNKPLTSEQRLDALSNALLHTRVILGIMVGLVLEREGRNVHSSDRESLFRALEHFVLEVNDEIAMEEAHEMLKNIFQGTSNN